MFKKKFLGMLCALALVTGLVPMTAFAVPITTDVVIHKMEVAAGTVLESHNGEEIDPGDFGGTNLEGATPLSGIMFKYWRVSDTATDAQLAAIQGISSLDQAEAYAVSNPGVLTGGTTTAATSAAGIVTVAGLGEGIYLFAEANGPANNVAEYIGVPFVLELPAMKANGTAYFGEGADALHVYPKNAIEIPGLDLETRNAVSPAGERIGSSSFDLFILDEYGSFVPTTPASLDLTSGFTTLADLPAGNYKLVNTVAPAGYLIDDRPIYFTVSGGVVSFDAAASNPKSYFTPKVGTSNDMITLVLASEPVPEKTVDGGNTATYQIGDEITWTVTLPVPDDINLYVEYTMNDTLDSALSWAGVNGDVVVTSDGTILTNLTHYDQANSTSSLTLVFFPAALVPFAGEELTITYKTYINDTAVMGEDIYNDVSINFDNGHGGTGTTRPVDPPSVWTGGAKFKKVDGTNTSVVLQGAEFKIATDAAGTTFVTWTQEMIDANAAGSFVTPVVGADIVMVSDATGLFQIKGLEGGTYYLVETKAPNHNGTQYNLLRDPAAFEITKTSYDDASTFSVENKSGLEIPQTGGMGTLIFTVVGLSLMALAIFLFRKKKAHKDQSLPSSK